MTSRPQSVVQVPVASMSLERFVGVLDEAAHAGVLEMIERGQTVLRSRVVWNVNSTARGGAVAEMLQSLIGYARGAGVDARWMVIRGDEEFFRITKRMHNRLHGAPGTEALSMRKPGPRMSARSQTAQHSSGSWSAPTISWCCTTHRRPGCRRH